MVLVIVATVAVVIVVFARLRSQWPPPKREATQQGIDYPEPEAHGDRRIDEAVETVARHFPQVADRSQPRAVISLAAITRRIARGTDAWRSVEGELIRRAGQFGYLLEFREGDRGLEAVLTLIQDGWANEAVKM